MMRIPPRVSPVEVVAAPPRRPRDPAVVDAVPAVNPKPVFVVPPNSQENP